MQSITLDEDQNKPLWVKSIIELIESNDPGGSPADEQKPDTVGINYWGIAILLRDFEFNEDMFRWLAPLIKMGNSPQEDDNSIAGRIWSELYAAYGSSGTYTPSIERSRKILQMLKKVHHDHSSSPEMLNFLLPIIDKAKKDLENEERVEE